MKGLAQYLPCLATIVTCNHNNQRNALAVAWHMSVNMNPALYAISVAGARFSHELISKSRQFAVNFVPLKSARLVAATGGSSGKQTDKFKAFGLEFENGVKTQTPILSIAYAAFECVLEDEHTYTDHTIFVGRVVAIHQAIEAYSDEGIIDINSVKPCLYMGKERYLNITEHELTHLGRKTTANEMLD